MEATTTGTKASDVAVIQDLVIRERYWRDRANWDAMRSAYTDDAQVRVTWFQGSIDEYIDSSRNPPWEDTSLSTHRLSPTVVTVAGDRALAETPALIELRLDVDDVLVDLTISVRLLSRVARTSDGWRLASMDAIYEKDAIQPVHPADRLAISAADTVGYRRAYQFLGYGARGRLPGDIPGDDRPDLTAALYTAATTWLRTT